MCWDSHQALQHGSRNIIVDASIALHVILHLLLLLVEARLRLPEPSHDAPLLERLLPLDSLL